MVVNRPLPKAHRRTVKGQSWSCRKNRRHITLSETALNDVRKTNRYYWDCGQNASHI